MIHTVNGFVLAKFVERKSNLILNGEADQDSGQCFLHVAPEEKPEWAQFVGDRILMIQGSQVITLEEHEKYRLVAIPLHSIIAFDDGGN